jgi:hypothetical protein
MRSLKGYPQTARMENVFHKKIMYSPSGDHLPAECPVKNGKCMVII